MAERFSHK